MKSWVVVTVEGGCAYADVYQGDEPGVYDPVIIDWDRLDVAEPDYANDALDEFEEVAFKDLPVGWYVRDNILATVKDERERF